MTAPEPGLRRADGSDPAGAGILHVDMDAFFVSVELLRRPELRGRPVVVGGSGARGVVAAASYEARSFGVHSAMPGARARRLCPHAVFLPGDHARYSEVSARVMEVFRSFTPLVEPISLDEAFLDVRGARRLMGTPMEIAHRLRARILEQEGLTCSVGVARVKFLAKLASEEAKPKASPTGPVFGDGVFEVAPDRELAFLHALPAKALWGVGPATLARLERIGVRTVGDLAALPLETVTGALGRASGAHLHALANARDPRPVVPSQAAKSISHEETFARDRFRRDELDVEAVRLSDAVATRLRRVGVVGRTVTVKVRFGDFTTITRSATVDGGLDSGHQLARIARGLLAAVDPSPGVRLLGVGVSQLDDRGNRQLSLDDLLAAESSEGGADWSTAEEAMDAVRARFGDGALGPASLAGPGGIRVARKGQQQWGPDADPAEP
ncbi:DNA polymerase IV [Aquihabitans daechungensis]|uniref:DNA polymerase IV n=1 Tax=Aquihabitans daechungensis TaxID=1052257 RepID=UPI003B9DD8F1